MAFKSLIDHVDSVNPIRLDWDDRKLLRETTKHSDIKDVRSMLELVYNLMTMDFVPEDFLCIFFELCDLFQEYNYLLTTYIKYSRVISIHYELTEEIFDYNIKKWNWDLEGLDPRMTVNMWKEDLSRAALTGGSLGELVLEKLS
jgi:hypothetical protein